MRFIHTADLHIGGIPAIGKITQFGIREREYDLILALERIKSVIIDESAEVLIVAGDIFHNCNPDSTSRTLWAKFLINLIKMKYTSLREIYFVTGNHDCPNNDIKSDALEVDGEYLNLSDTDLKIFISSDIEFIAHNGYDDLTIGMIMVPYKDNKEYVREKVLALYEKYENSVDKFILVGHIEIKEAELGANDTKLKCGFSYTEDIFSHPKLAYAALGHIHKPQTFQNPNNCAVICYSGSPISKDFNEASDGRIVIIGEINQNLKFSYHEVPIPDRDFITIENGNGFDDLTSDVVNGSIIKLKFKGTREYLGKINTAQMISKLDAMGALQIKVDKTIVKDVKDNSNPEFTEMSSIPAAIRTYINSFSPKILNKNRLNNLATERIKGRI
jgi:DNA repair exonuclease SbcCD nuclease subunit